MSKISSPANVLLSLCVDCGGSHTAANATGVECIQCGKTCAADGKDDGAPSKGRQYAAAMFSVLLSASQCCRALIRRRRSSWILSCVGSISFNVSVLLVLMLAWIGSKPNENPVILQAGFLAAGPENTFEQLTDPDSGAAASLSSVTVTALPESLLKGQSKSDGMSLLSGDGIGNGLSLAGTGAGGGGIFQGSPDAGSFAYVVDASGSMSGPRMQLVLKELVRSINALADHQQFFVIFFSHRSFPMMWPASEVELIAASPANRKRIVDWALNVDPDGETKPQKSLTTALRLSPDVLYFLTDGEIPRESIRIVERLRTKNTVVNTICVGDARSGQLMKQIARKGNGTYTQVR